MAETRSMDSVEREIAMLFERQFSARGWAEVRLTVHDAGGAQSFDGTRLGVDGVERPLRDEDTWDIVGFDEATSRQLSDLLFDLHGASQAAPLGPWYCAEIIVRRGSDLTATYHWEGTPVKSVAELKVHGLSVPLHPFKRALPAALLREWPERLLADAIDTFVIAQSQRGAPIPPSVLEVFALYDWIGDTNNGGHNQYFGRRQDQVGAGIDAVARQEQTDLDDRFFEVSGAMQERLCEFIRQHVDTLATDAVVQG